MIVFMPREYLRYDKITIYINIYPSYLPVFYVVLKDATKYMIVVYASGVSKIR